MRTVACALALACAGTASLRAQEIRGRYATPGVAGGLDGTAEVLEVTPRRHAYGVSWQAGANQRRRRGWGLLDGGQLAVGLSTGGSAYGVAIYHHVPAERAWVGRWITSLDGGAAVGTIRFSDDNALEGRHEVACERPGAGNVSGNVDIKMAADNYHLTFRLGRAVSYRGIGLLLPGDRLAVAWSFGSAPEIGVYAAGADGSLAEQHVFWSPHPDVPATAQFKPMADDTYVAASLSADALPGSGSPEAEAAGVGLGPVAPRVKAWSYHALLHQYGDEGWAERWLEQQLTMEERQLLQNAIRRHETLGKTDADLDTHSIGTLIDEEHRRSRRDN